MANLTLTIDDELLKRARIRALERGTSVNALVRDYIEHFADEDAASEAIAGLFEIAARSRAGSGPEGRTWTREEIQRYP
jgi:plasmid stability protein